MEQRAIRAETLIHLGVRQVLEGAEICPWQSSHFGRAQDVARETHCPRLLHHVPIRPFQLDEHIFSRNLRRPGGEQQSVCRNDHGTLAPFIGRCGMHSFFLMGEQLTQAKVLLAMVNLICMGRLTVLSKSWGLRGSCRGCRSQIGGTLPAVERATSPHQCAMTTDENVWPTFFRV